MFTLLQFVLLFPIFTYVSTDEPLCAELEVHKQKWIGGAGARQLGEAERAVDLQECLRRCCANTDCSAVSFSGFLVGPTPSPTSANCALFQCAGDGECPVVDGSALADEGLLSVRLRRKQASTTIATTTTILITLTASPASSTSPSAGEKPDEDNELRPTWPSPKNGLGQVLPLEEEEDVTAKDNETTRASLFNLDTWDERFPLRADTTPVWAIGLAIVATIVCLGLLLTLLCTFLCHRRYRLRMRTTEISGPKKMPTLHAFNPT